MGNVFWFGNESSADYHIRIERYPRRTVPRRKMQTFSVAGRNGNLHILEDAYENYIQPYEIYFHGEASSPELAHKIAAWLMTKNGYQRLTDTYDPTHYRMALFSGPMDIENILNRYGRCTIQFDCSPQSFLVSGDEPMKGVDSKDEIFNKTDFPAKPLITVFGNAPGTLTLGGRTVEIKEIAEPIILDCELMQAYSKAADGTLVSRNKNIYAPLFPVIPPGRNVAVLTGGIAELEIIPRWWEL